ncbi:MAG: SAM-dependent methyltransferase [Verrucomicrobia bacterium]|nr:SAM-dependent methyltransferase [Verrucomicrobiota bacterium]
MADTVQEFIGHCREALAGGTWVKLTLGAHHGADATLHNVIVRPVELRDGLKLSFVHRHATRDITRNLAPDEGLDHVAALLAVDFGSAHLFTTGAEIELRRKRPDAAARLIRHPPRHTAPATRTHDRARARPVDPAAAPWLQTLGVTNAAGAPREGMAGKLRQIGKFAEILRHSLEDLPPREGRGLDMVDMGCGKGYLTFAAFEVLRRDGWSPLRVTGIERRADLVDACNAAVAAHALEGLSFTRGDIASTPVGRTDVLVALHACDTATDDALAAGIRAEASLILASPCCHKELRPALRPPAVLAAALRHGILLERHAEFVTDALRAGLLEWAGYRTRVFEFVATEHTAKNLMIAAVRRPGPCRTDEAAQEVRDLAAFHGIRTQHLAGLLGFALDPEG